MATEGVVIGVVLRDRLSLFPRCLEALYTNTDGLFRVVLVVGGADHATRQHLHTLQGQYANLTVVLIDRLLAQATARNLVLQHVHERFCVHIENDTLVHLNWLPPLLECMRDERAAVVALLVLDFWERRFHTAGGVFEVAWAVRNRRFQHKWHVTYDGSRKQRFYRRQHRKLGLARWYPSTWTVRMVNVYLGVLKRLQARVKLW